MTQELDGIPSTNRETLLAELDVHKTEFSELRTEILHMMETQRQYTNFALVAIGVEITAATAIIESNQLIIFLFFPFVYLIILSEMQNAVEGIHHISSYFVESLIPRANQIMSQLDGTPGNRILLWELKVTKGIAKRDTHFLQRVLLQLIPSRFWIPILAVAASQIAFIVIKQESGTFSNLELLLIFMQLIFLIVFGVRSQGMAAKRVTVISSTTEE